MTEERKQMLQRMSRAAYDYATERTRSNWENKRPGLQYERARGLDIASCGAFRQWAILSHDGVVGWCVDGFRQRSTMSETGSVFVLIGDGKFVFPHDDSRTDHSLAFQASNNSQLIAVTNTTEVPWEARIEAMTQELEAAVVRLRDAVTDYDENRRLTQELRRSAEVAAATQAVRAAI